MSFSDSIAFEPNKYYHKDRHSILKMNTAYKKVLGLSLNTVSVSLWSQ